MLVSHLKTPNITHLAQVGPLLKKQAVTNTIAAAFSFALNTNLNTTRF